MQLLKCTLCYGKFKIRLAATRDGCRRVFLKFGPRSVSGKCEYLYVTTLNLKFKYVNVKMITVPEIICSPCTQYCVLNIAKWYTIHTT